MKKVIFGVLLVMLLIISGCSNNVQNVVSGTDETIATVSEKSTSVKEKATKSTEKGTAKATEGVSDETPSEKATENIKTLPLVKNNQENYLSLRNTGIIGKQLVYSNNSLWEYHKNDITTVLPEAVADYVGEFFLLDDYIYFTPSYSENTDSSVQLWRIKKDGTDSEFIADDLATNVNCVYVNGYILYDCYSSYTQSNYGIMALNLETKEKVNYASINHIQYTYQGIAYYLDGNHIKYLNPETGETGFVRNTGGSFVCGDSHYIYYISSGSGNGLFRIDLNNRGYSANEFVRSNVSTSCVVINDVVYYYPFNALTTSKILAYDINKAKDLQPIDIVLTRKIYRFWNENGYLLFSVQNGKEDLNMSDYVVNPDTRKAYRVSNYAMAVGNVSETATQPYREDISEQYYSE